MDCVCGPTYVDCVRGPMWIVYVRTYVCDPTYVCALCTYEHNIMQVACVHTYVHTYVHVCQIGSVYVSTCMCVSPGNSVSLLCHYLMYT